MSSNFSSLKPFKLNVEFHNIHSHIFSAHNEAAISLFIICQRYSNRKRFMFDLRSAMFDKRNRGEGFWLMLDTGLDAVVGVL